MTYAVGNGIVNEIVNENRHALDDVLTILVPTAHVWLRSFQGIVTEFD